MPDRFDRIRRHARRVNQLGRGLGVTLRVELLEHALDLCGVDLLGLGLARLGRIWVEPVVRDGLGGEVILRCVRKGGAFALEARDELRVDVVCQASRLDGVLACDHDELLLGVELLKLTRCHQVTFELDLRDALSVHRAQEPLAPCLTLLLLEPCGLAEQLGEVIGVVKVVAAVRDADVSVGDELVVRAIELLELVDPLTDKEPADPITRSVRDRRLDLVHATERGKLVHEHEQAVLVRVIVQGLGEGVDELLEQQAHQGPETREVIGGNVEVEAEGMLGVLKLAQREIRRTRRARDERVFPQIERHIGACDPPPLNVLGRVLSCLSHPLHEVLDSAVLGALEVQHVFERAVHPGDEVGHAAQRLHLLRVEHIQDRSRQQLLGAIVPEFVLLPSFSRPQDLPEVHRVTDDVRTPAQLEQRVKARAEFIGGVEVNHVTKLRAPPGRQVVVLTFDIRDKDRTGVTQECRDDPSDPLSRTRRREPEQVLGAVVVDRVPRMVGACDHAGDLSTRLLRVDPFFE